MQAQLSTKATTPRQWFSCPSLMAAAAAAAPCFLCALPGRPIRRMMSLLKHHWHPNRIDDPSRKNISLAIQYGELGARLTHNHKTQFYFVLQSLTLWLEVRLGPARSLKQLARFFRDE